MSTSTTITSEARDLFESEFGANIRAGHSFGESAAMAAHEVDRTVGSGMGGRILFATDELTIGFLVDLTNRHSEI